jgi:hypothetical protein
MFVGRHSSYHDPHTARLLGASDTSASAD